MVAHIPWHFTVALRHRVVASLLALISPDVLQDLLSLPLAEAGFLQDTGTTADLSSIAKVALVVDIPARADLHSKDLLVLFSIEAPTVLLAAHECLVLAEEASIAAKATIIRRPRLVVGVRLPGIVRSLALWLMQLGEVDVDEEGLVIFLEFDLSVACEKLCCLVILQAVLGVSAVNDELLRDVVRFDEDVVDHEHAI